MERMSSEAGHYYSFTHIRDKLDGKRAMDWLFVQTIVRVCHRYANIDGEPDLAPWLLT
jgi:hypothetical protein